MRFFEMRNNEIRLPGSKGRARKIDKSSLEKDSSVPLMYHDPSDHGSSADPDSEHPKENAPFLEIVEVKCLLRCCDILN